MKTTKKEAYDYPKTNEEFDKRFGFMLELEMCDSELYNKVRYFCVSHSNQMARIVDSECGKCNNANSALDLSIPNRNALTKIDNSSC